MMIYLYERRTAAAAVAGHDFHVVHVTPQIKARPTVSQSLR